MNTVAIIPAAGRGLRLGGAIPKPYLTLGDKPLLAHTLQAFEDCPDVGEVYVVAAEDKVACCRRDIVRKYCLRKVTRVVVGGERRQDSVYNGLRQVPAGIDIVLVHDAARPLVGPQLISQSIQEARRWGAAIVALPLSDTVKQVSPEGLIRHTLSRDGLWAAQTPQTFAYPLLKRAFEEAYRHGFVGTDEASLVERLGHKIRLVKGSAYNIKVTTPEDLIIAEAILQGRARDRRRSAR
jgi:2-C-methyl-D-erythritol 4-phosphate cytidylyltransferase